MNTNQRMHTNDNLLYPELSYKIVGVCFSVQNEKGRYGKEKHYADTFEEKMKQTEMSYRREYPIGATGNIVDFLINDLVIVELKAKTILLPEDYRQIQRYLQESGVNLGLLVNFRQKLLKPERVVRIQTPKRQHSQPFVD